MQKLAFKLIMGLVIINFFYVLSGVIHYPLIGIDVFAIWLLKAKAFYVYGGFPLEFLREIDYSHPQYPVLLPWFFYLIYKLIGSVNEFWVLIIYPFIYISIIFITYKLSFKMGLGKLKSLFFAYIYSMLSPLLAQAGREHAGSADIVITLIYWIAVFVAFLIHKNKANLVWAIAMLVVIASQIKLEGIFLVWLLVFLPIKQRQKIFWVCLSVLPAIAWIYLRVSLGIKSDFGFFAPSFLEIIRRVYAIIVNVIIQMLNIRNWYIFWPLFWLLIFIQKTKYKFIKMIIQPSLIVMVLSFFVPYIFADLDTGPYVSSSVDRIMLQLSPFFYLIFLDRTSILLSKTFRYNYEE